MRLLLVQPPFFAIDRPSLGLSLLRAAAEDAGVECDVRYANLEFASRIGPSAYNEIVMREPSRLLFGEVVFTAALWDRLPDADAISLAVSAALQSSRPFLGSARGQSRDEVTEWLRSAPDRLESLARLAAEFVEEQAQSYACRDYDLIGLSATFQLVPALALARAIKARHASPPVVIGGAHCEGDMGLAVHEAFSWLDFVGRGEGERLIVDLVRHVCGAERIPVSIPGLVWRDADGQSKACGFRATASSLDGLPPPKYDDWFAQRQAIGPPVTNQVAMLPVETSRGCWYGVRRQCLFCGLNGGSIDYRTKSTGRALAEYRDLLAYEAPLIFATDNILDPAHIDSLLPQIAQLNHDRKLFYEVKANLNEAQVERITAAGIGLIQPGIESLSTGVLRLMRKGTTALANVRLLRLAAQYNIGVTWNLLYGFPGEAEEDYLEMIALVPSLTHLPPPAAVAQVRLDRFSPLFREAGAMGLTNVRPLPGYRLAYPMEAALVERVAYSFDYDYDHTLRMRLDSYVPQLIDAASAWRDGAERVRFDLLRREDRIYLLDSRPAAQLREAVLTGVEAATYLAALPGRSRQQLVRHAGASIAEVNVIVDAFLQLRWVAELDGRVLSLAAPRASA